MSETLRGLYSFEGRTNRARYWAVAVISGLVGRLAGLSLSPAIAPVAADGSWSGAALALQIAYLVLAVLLLALFAATAVRRLHDTGMSGKWALLFVGVPSLVAVLLPPDPSPGAASGEILGRLAIFLATFVIMMAALYVLGVKKGTDGPNQYGPDPLRAKDEAAPAV
jgi:uncharacterized membrane protein YhaH (DUF805 family)